MNFLSSLISSLNFKYIQFAVTDKDKSKIYTDGTGISAIDTAGDKILGAVGGIGMTVFVLAFLVISLCLGLMSLSPQNASRMWKALLVCGAAALLFFSAYMFPGQIAKLIGQ